MYLNVPRRESLLMYESYCLLTWDPFYWHGLIGSRTCVSNYIYIFPWASYQIRRIACCACARNAGNVFPHHRGLAIPTCIAARAWRTCRDACRDRYLAVSVEVGGGENVPGIPGACATRNFTYLVIGPWDVFLVHALTYDLNMVVNTYPCPNPDASWANLY